MLKRLRVKFIALNMIIVAAVLILTFSAVCILDHQQNITRVTQELNTTLERIIPPDDPHRQKKHPNDALFDFFDPVFDSNNTLENPDGFDDVEIIGGFKSLDGTNKTSSEKTEENAENDALEAPEAEEQSQTQRDTALPPRIGGSEEEKRIPIATYLLRGTTLIELTKHSTASLDESVLTQAAQEVAQAPDGDGELKNLGLFYAKKTFNDEAYVAFADASAADSWQSVALILGGVGLVALLLFFVISLFFSRWALAPVAKAWEKQRQFVADASHDLKTPLTVILANTSILEEHPEKTIAEQKQWIESTEHEARSMQALVGDLLTLARIDEAEAHAALPGKAIVSERVDFSNLVEGELLQMESLAFEHGITLTSAIAPDLFVSGTPADLRRIVTTLVDNACKYAGMGQVVSVDLTATGRKATLIVHNTGSAIDPTDLPYIFDRFYRADKARNRNDIGGHGLGLAIAQALAHEAKGTITAQSSESDGTTFTLTLPLG